MPFKSNAELKTQKLKNKYYKKIENIANDDNLTSEEKNKLYYKLIDKLQILSDNLSKKTDIAAFIHSANAPIFNNQLLNIGIGLAGITSLLIGSIGVANFPELTNYPELSNIISTISNTLGILSAIIFASNSNLNKGNYSFVELQTIQKAFDEHYLIPAIDEITAKLKELIISNFKGKGSY